MSRFFDAFEVYNKNKHAPADFKSHGGSSLNTRATTAYMFAREYRGPSTGEKKEAAAAALAADVKAGKVELVNDPNTADSSRKSSVSEEAMPQMVDISKLTREEFEALYNKINPGMLRKGEPNNKVNF